MAGALSSTGLRPMVFSALFDKYQVVLIAVIAILWLGVGN
jgi:hypothetical protein